MYDLITSIGTMILLLAWIIQQTYLQATADKLSKLNSAKVTAAVIESNDLLLQAVADISGAKRELIDSLREKLKQDEDALFVELKTEHVITEHVEAKTIILGGISVGGSYSKTSKELTVDAAQIRKAASKAWWTFLVVYLAGGLLTLSGSVFKAVKKDDVVDDIT